MLHTLASNGGTCLKALRSEDVAQSRAEGIPDLLGCLRGKESPAAVDDATQGIVLPKMHGQACRKHADNKSHQARRALEQTAPLSWITWAIQWLHA